MKPRSLVLAAFALPVVAFGLSFTPQLIRARSAALTQLEQPSNWVPFSATARFAYPNGTVVLGKFYRSVDGSERLDLEVSPGQPARTTIKNIPTATYYMGMGPDTCCDQWASYPMKLPKEGWTPQFSRLDASAVEKLSTKWSGFDVYRLAKPNFTRLLVPALNYFAVLTDDPAGRRREFLDIRVGEQAKSLFEPPPGAIIERVNRYNGIVDEDENTARRR